MLEFNDKGKNNFLFYRGPISIEVVSFLANFLRELLFAEEKIKKRLFKTFIELAQNVAYYSAELKKEPEELEARRGVGAVTVDKIQNGFTVTTGNLIEKEHGPILEKNCSEINNMSDTDLRELKRKTRAQAAIKDIGAHIGLIHTAIISGSDLEINIEPIDQKYSYFTIKVYILE